MCVLVRLQHNTDMSAVGVGVNNPAFGETHSQLNQSKERAANYQAFSPGLLKVFLQNKEMKRALRSDQS